MRARGDGTGPGVADERWRLRGPRRGNGPRRRRREVATPGPTGRRGAARATKPTRRPDRAALAGRCPIAPATALAAPATTGDRRAPTSCVVSRRPRRAVAETRPCDEATAAELRRTMHGHRRRAPGKRRRHTRSKWGERLQRTPQAPASQEGGDRRWTRGSAAGGHPCRAAGREVDRAAVRHALRAAPPDAWFRASRRGRRWSFTSNLR